MMPDVYEFYNLGIGDPVPISASERIGIGDMLDKVLAYFPEGAGQEEEVTVRELQSLGTERWEVFDHQPSDRKKTV